MVKCTICGKEYSIKGIGTHMWRTHGEGKNFIPNKNLGGWNRGLTKESSSKVAQSSNTLKCKYASGEIIPPFLGKRHTVQAKDILRQKINARYKDGWQSTAGRTRKIKYSSSIAGNILVDGSWELAVAKYLDMLQLQWIRNTARFKYHNTITDKSSTYCPDFYVKDWDIYIEVKGYQTELDLCKWSQFPKKLLVWKKKELKKLGII